jgi:cbb3-type cytochrome oxidase subunit 3
MEYGIGLIIFILFVGAVVYYIRKDKKRKKAQAEPPVREKDV